MHNYSALEPVLFEHNATYPALLQAKPPEPHFLSQPMSPQPLYVSLCSIQPSNLFLQKSYFHQLLNSLAYWGGKNEKQIPFSHFIQAESLCSSFSLVNKNSVDRTGNFTVLTAKKPAALPTAFMEMNPSLKVFNCSLYSLQNSLVRVFSFQGSEILWPPGCR